MIIEDLPPAVIKILDSCIKLDPHVFCCPLCRLLYPVSSRLNTKHSEEVGSIDVRQGGLVPVTWYKPGHGPEIFIGVWLIFGLKP